MTQDEKLIWAAVYAAVQVDLVGPEQVLKFDVKRAVAVADGTIQALREFAEANGGSVHRDRDLALETRYTTPVEGIEL